MKEAKFNGLVRAPKESRYSYFINTVVEKETIFSLEQDDSLATTETESGSTVVCFWPEKEFAEYCKKGDNTRGLTQGVVTQGVGELCAKRLVKGTFGQGDVYLDRKLEV